MGTDKKEYENTLLIVESPTIKRIIDAFSIPYLNTIATNGFCWKPQYDFDRDQLTLKAVRGKRPIRNKIRDQARWAMQVVVASDADAAGDLIAYSIAKHLQRFELDLKRTIIRGINPDEIHQAIDSASYFSPSNLTRRLKNRYKWTHLLRKTPVNSEVPITYRHAFLVMLFIFCGRFPRKVFIDRGGTRYVSDSSRLMQINQEIPLSYQQTEEFYYQQYTPMNTFDVLDLVFHQLSYESYESVQEDLNTLFTSFIEPLQTGLISYPRTKERSFHESTWQRFESQWVERHSIESLLPRPLRNTFSDTISHEAIHPLQLKYTPAYVRPHLRKKYYDIYRSIYRYHMQTLQRPNRVNRNLYKETNTNHSYYQIELKEHENPHRESAYITPHLTVSELISRIMNYKGLRPSKVGRFTDYIVSEQYIGIDKYGNVKPGPSLRPLLSKLKNPAELSELLREVQQQLDTTLDTDMISNLLSSIFRKK